MGNHVLRWQNEQNLPVSKPLRTPKRSMSTEHPPLQQKRPPEPATEYTSFIDRTLIFIGDKAIKYWPIIAIGVIVLLLFMTMLIGGLVALRAIGERFNQLDAKQQERHILEEQLLEQAENALTEPVIPSEATDVDQSRWFRILEDAPADDKVETEVETDSDSNFLEETENQASKLEIEERIRQTPLPAKLLITQDRTWNLTCTGRGLFESSSDRCVLEDPRPQPNGDLAATSN
ncbi:MAG: hypothetical protein AAF902_21535 [Chloroflexota bacterium]